MTLTMHPDLIQGSDEWLQQRCGIITASVVGQLITERELTAREFDCPACGAAMNTPCISKVKAGNELKTVHTERAEVARTSEVVVLEPSGGDTAMGLTRQLVAERITGWTDPTYVSDDMLRGIEDEPRAREKYSEHRRVNVREVGFITEDKWGFTIGYSPDGMVGDDGLIECKSRRPKTQVKTIVTGEVPTENMAQLQTGLLVTGRKWIDYVSYTGGMPMFITRVHPDPKWFDAILNAVSKFEANAAAIIREYQQRVTQLNLPMTERVLDLEITI